MSGIVAGDDPDPLYDSSSEERSPDANIAVKQADGQDGAEDSVSFASGTVSSSPATPADDAISGSPPATPPRRAPGSPMSPVSPKQDSSPIEAVRCASQEEAEKVLAVIRRLERENQMMSDNFATICTENSRLTDRVHELHARTVQLANEPLQGVSVLRSLYDQDQKSSWLSGGKSATKEKLRQTCEELQNEFNTYRNEHISSNGEVQALVADLQQAHKQVAEHAMLITELQKPRRKVIFQIGDEASGEGSDVVIEMQGMHEQTQKLNAELLMLKETSKVETEQYAKMCSTLQLERDDFERRLKEQQGSAFGGDVGADVSELETRIAELKIESEMTMKQLLESEEGRQQAIADLEQCRAELDAREADGSGDGSDGSDLKKQLKASEKKIKRLEAQLSVAKNVIDSNVGSPSKTPAPEGSAALERDLEKREEEIERLEKEVTRLRANSAPPGEESGSSGEKPPGVAESLQAMAALVADKEVLESALVRLQTELVASKETIASMEEVKNDSISLQKYSELENKNTRLDDEMEMLQSKATQLELEREAYIMEVASLKESLQAITSMTEKDTVAAAANSEELVALQAARDELTTLLQDAETQRRESEERASSLEAKLNDAKVETESLQSEVAKTSERADDLQNQLSKAESQLDDTTAKLTAAEATRSAGDQETSNRIAELSQSLKAAEREASDLTTQLSQVQISLASMTTEKEGVEAEHEQAKQEVTSLQGEVASLQERITALEAELEEQKIAGEAQMTASVEMGMQNEQLKLELEQAKQEAEQLTTEKDEAVATCESQKQQIGDLEAKVSELVQSKETIESDASNAGQALDELRVASSAADTEIAALREKAAALEEQIVSLETERDTALNTVEELRTEGEAHMTATIELGIENEQLKNSNAVLEDKLKTAVEAREAISSASTEIRDDFATKYEELLNMKVRNEGIAHKQIDSLKEELATVSAERDALEKHERLVEVSAKSDHEELERRVKELEESNEALSRAVRAQPTVMATTESPAEAGEAAAVKELKEKIANEYVHTSKYFAITCDNDRLYSENERLSNQVVALEEEMAVSTAALQERLETTVAELDAIKSSQAEISTSNTSHVAGRGPSPMRFSRSSSSGRYTSPMRSSSPAGAERGGIAPEVHQALRRSNEKLIAERDALRRRVSDLSHQLSTASEAAQGAVPATASEEELARRVTTLEEAIATERNVSESIKAERQQLQSRVAELLRTQRHSVDADASDAVEVDRLRAVVEDLENTVAKLQGELEDTEAAKTTAETEASVLRDTLVAEKLLTEDLKSRVDGSGAEASSAASEAVAQLQNAVERHNEAAQEWESERRRLRSELDSQATELAVAAKSKAADVPAVAAVAPGESEAERRAESLQTANAELVSESARLHQELEEARSQLRDALAVPVVVPAAGAPTDSPATESLDAAAGDKKKKKKKKSKRRGLLDEDDDDNSTAVVGQDAPMAAAAEPAAEAGPNAAQLSAELTACERELAVIRGENDRMKAALAEANDKLADAVSKRDEAESAVSKANTQSEALSDEAQALRTRVSALEAELDQAVKAPAPAPAAKPVPVDDGAATGIRELERDLEAIMADRDLMEKKLKESRAATAKLQDDLTLAQHELRLQMELVEQLEDQLGMTSEFSPSSPREAGASAGATSVEVTALKGRIATLEAAKQQLETRLQKKDDDDLSLLRENQESARSTDAKVRALERELKEKSRRLEDAVSQLVPVKTKLVEHVAVCDRLGIHHPFPAEFETETTFRMGQMKTAQRPTLHPPRPQAAEAKPQPRSTAAARPSQKPPTSREQRPAVVDRSVNEAAKRAQLRRSADRN